MLKKALYTLSIVSISTAALASGYQISEYSTVNLGRSFAGAGVVGDDFSALGYNPAGMSINETSGVQGGAAGILLHSDYKDLRPVSEGGTDIKRSSKMGRVLPHIFTQYKASDKLTLGIGFYTPYGLITDYKNDFFGSEHGLFSGLKVMDLSAGFSYQIHPMFSVGAAVNGQYIHARLTKTKGGAFVDMEGDDTGVGYMLGATFTPQKNIRLGISYRSKVSHELEGDITMGPIGSDIKAKVTTPELMLISGAYDVNNKLTLSASARWTKWQRFKNLDVFNTTQLGPYPAGSKISSTHENWKNTWFYSIGADYKINENWTVRLGTAYDETVIKSSAYRTVRIPDGHRLFASLGLSYATGNWQYDLAYTHVWMRHGNAHGGERINPNNPNSASQNANIRYSHAGAYMGGFSIQYKF